MDHGPIMSREVEMGRVREKKRRQKEDQRGEGLRRKKMQARQKVEKLRNSVFCRWHVAPEGRKGSSLKRRVRSHLARQEIKKMRVVVARSACRSQNVQNTAALQHF